MRKFLFTMRISITVIYVLSCFLIMPRAEASDNIIQHDSVVVATLSSQIHESAIQEKVREQVQTSSDSFLPENSSSQVSVDKSVLSRGALVRMLGSLFLREPLSELITRIFLFGRTDTMSRRTWFRICVGLGTVGFLTSCNKDEVEEPEIPAEPQYDGTPIDEQYFIDFNARFYTKGIHPSSRFVYDFIPHGGGMARWSQPTSIAFRLQYLIEENDADEIEKILQNLRLAQQTQYCHWKGLLPWFCLKDQGGFVGDRFPIGFGENTTLSMRVAMVAEAYKNNATMHALAMDFLEAQREGYREMYDPREHAFYGVVYMNTGAKTDYYHMDRFFNEFNSGVAFVLTYFFEDKELIDEAWGFLLESTQLPVQDNMPLAWNGSAFQFFWPLLTLDPSDMSQSHRDALYNALYAYLSDSYTRGIWGILSAGGGTANDYLGNNGLIALAEGETVEEMWNIYALTAALRLFPVASRERETLLRWMHAFMCIKNIESYGDIGLYAGIDKCGYRCLKVYAIDAGSMILFNSQGPTLLRNFVARESATGITMTDLFQQVHMPISRVNTLLPNPPLTQSLVDKETLKSLQTSKENQGESMEDMWYQRVGRFIDYEKGQAMHNGAAQTSGVIAATVTAGMSSVISLDVSTDASVIASA